MTVRRLRIYSIACVPLSSVEGPATHVRELHEALGDRGVHVTLWLPDLGLRPRSTIDGVETRLVRVPNISILRYLIFDVFMFLAMSWDFIRGRRPDVLYLRQSYSTLLPAILAWCFRVPMIVEVNGFFEWDLKARNAALPVRVLSKLGERLSYGVARRIICVTEGIKEQLDAARNELANVQRQGDLARAGELTYGDIPDLERRLAAAEAAGEQRMLQEVVSEHDIAMGISRWTGIPVDRLLESEADKLLHMEDRLHERVVGQGTAIASVADAVRRARAGLSDPNRPIGSFIFLGPTGVGKTELARALAQYLFDDEQNMVRIDMSEYQEKHAVSRLVGAPPGYVGYEEGGQLTEAVWRRPFRVVLFDEVEKAHPDAFNMLLQILEDGRLTDGQGKTVDFRNTLIIMTSNLGTSEGSKEPLGFLRQAAEDSSVRMRSSVEDALKSTFRPEFLNRIDEIIVFEALTAEQIHGIVDLMIEEVRNRVAERQVSITLTEAAREWLASEGFDPVYGARPLRRAIQRFVENPLSKRILASELSEGDEVLIDANEDGLTFEKSGEAVAVS